MDLCARFLHRPNTPWVEPDTLAALADAPFDLLEQAKGGLLFPQGDRRPQQVGAKGITDAVGQAGKIQCAAGVRHLECHLRGLLRRAPTTRGLYETLSGLCINVPRVERAPGRYS